MISIQIIRSTKDVIDWTNPVAKDLRKSYKLLLVVIFYI